MRIFLANVETVDRGGESIRRAAFDRTGVTEYGAAEVRPGKFVCVAQGINAAPAGTIDLGTTGAPVASNRETTVANFLGVARGDVSGKTVGQLILLLDPGTWRPQRDGMVRISLAGVPLHEERAIQGGAVEITEPFTYSNGRLSTVSSSAWDDEDANMAVSSNAVVWSAGMDSGIASHNTELSTETHYAQVKVTLGNTSDYSGGGVLVRNDGSVGATADGYRVEAGHWNIGGINYNVGITRYDNGSTTEVATANVSGTTTSVHTLRAEADGTTITVYVDGVLELTYGSASSYTTNKFVGLYAGSFGGTTITLEDFEAGALDPPPIGIAAGGSGNSASSGATLAFDCGLAFAVGDIIVVVISCDNAGASGVSSLSSVADAGSNSYELLQATYDPGAANAGQTIGIAWAEITTALASTDDITINFSPNTTSKAAVVHRLRPGTGLAIDKVTSAFTGGSATGTPTVTTSSITSGDVVIAGLAAESNAAVTADSDTTNGTWTTQISATGSTGTSGTSSRVASQAKVVTATATQTYNPTITSCDNILGWITFTPVSAAANLVVADSFHGHTADAVVLTQVHVLVVADAVHANTVDVVVLTQLHELAGVADSAHGHTVDALTLTQVHVLTVADSTHEHTVEAVTLTQAHILAVDDSFHQHTSDNVALTQVHELLVADASHEHTVDAVVLNVSVNLTVDDAEHAHTVEAVALTQTHVLTVSDAAHEHASENVAPTQVHELVVADAAHEHTVDALALAQGHVLVVADAVHEHVSESVTLTQVHNLTVDDAFHEHTSESVTLAAGGALEVDDAFHGHTVDAVALTQVHSLAVDDAFHGHTSESTTLTQGHQLAVADSVHEHAVDAVALTQDHALVVVDAAHGHTVDNVVLTVGGVLTVDDAFHAHTVENVTLTAIGPTVTILDISIRLLGSGIEIDLLDGAPSLRLLPSGIDVGLVSAT